MALNPVGQYATAANLRARQRLWERQVPPFDLVGWVLGLAGLDVSSERVVLDLGCGNGLYLRELRQRGVDTVGCDLSLGMLAAARPHPHVVNANAETLPFRTGGFGVVLAPHMLYHLDDRAAAAAEMRRVLASSGTCVVVTNGSAHMRELRELVESAVGRVTPGWEMRNPSTHVFSLDNGAAQLRPAFQSVECVRPVGVAPVRISDAAIAADYVASVADHYQHETELEWGEVVEEVRARVRSAIDRHGTFVVTSEVGAFVCR